MPPLLASWAHEGMDATNITFTEAQLSLISQVAEAAKSPVAVVIMTATPLDLSPLLVENHGFPHTPRGEEAWVPCCCCCCCSHTALPPCQSNPKVGAILHVGQPSVTAVAIGDIIFGDAVPAGRTIQTVYPAS